MRLISVRVIVRATIVAALSPIFLPIVTRAQFTTDYQTNIISGVVSNWVGKYFVGSNTVFDLVRVENGGVLSNGPCYIGYRPGADNNEVVISGSGSLWYIPIDLVYGEIIVVGYEGSGNTLIVSNQGAIVNPTGTGIAGDGKLLLGYYASSSNNLVLVSDPGSLVSNLFFVEVGHDGPGNTMVISNGGAVVSRDGFIGTGPSDSTITNDASNRVVITGTGSVWTNSNFTWVGYGFSSGNSLIIDDHGALITAGTGCVGCVYECMTCVPDRNTARIANGGLWQTSDLLMNGSSNSIVVAGGTVLTTNLVIGPCSNFLQLDRGSVIVTNAATDATLDIQGKLIQSGGVLHADKLVITNACGHFIHIGGTLLVGNLVLDANLDADGDGIPNGYEQSRGLDPLNAADANADSDGDGFTNLEEFQAGTDPANSASAFRILSVVPTNNDLLISWAAGGGRTNVVQSAADLADSYTNISPNIILPGSGDVTTNYLNAGAATNAPARFYRIRLVP